MALLARSQRGTAGLLLFVMMLSLRVTADDQVKEPAPPLKMDVAAAMHRAETAAPSADVVQLGPVTVRSKRRLADTLPCIGCDGRQLLPLKRLQDFGDVIGSLLISHPPSRPETPEDRSLSFAHEQSCIDGSACLLPK